ncbi:hypothetical protein QTP86_033834 [Hemibagrus guttatus]|nr:hypothetical protein QTP86_033834 [Hemibagrus guttatus]
MAVVVNPGLDRSGSLWRLRHQGRIHPGRSANPSQGTHTHTGQFRDANQPTMHVFGLGEETGVPRGNPRGTGRTCKLHTHMAEAGIEPPTLELQSSSFPSERSKVAYVISLLSSKAHLWATAEWECQSAFCASNDAFSRELRKVFDTSAPRQDAA